MSYTSELEHWRIEANAYYDHVEETRIISDPARGIRAQRTKIRWEVKRHLGQGGFGEVRLEAHDGKHRAVKRIGTTSEKLNDAEYMRELRALLEFSKPKYKEAAVFVEFYGWFTNGPNVFLAMEYVPLGDLDKNIGPGKVVEVEAKEIGHQILVGLNIMHLESFAHRDLKPQNVLVVNGPPNWWVKLADFGLTKRLAGDTVLHTRAGTTAYMAPEVLGYFEASSWSSNEGYSNAVDLWAFGCIIYRLVTGVVPFPQSRNLIEYCEDKFPFPEDALSDITVKGARFIRQLLHANPNDRLTTSEALQHPWISGVDSSMNLSSTLQQPSSPTEDYNVKLDSTKGDRKTYTAKSDSTKGDWNTVSHAGLKSVEYSSQSASSLSNPNSSPQEAECKDIVPSSLPAAQNSGSSKNETTIRRKPIPSIPGQWYDAPDVVVDPAPVTARIVPTPEQAGIVDRNVVFDQPPKARFEDGLPQRKAPPPPARSPVWMRDNLGKSFGPMATAAESGPGEPSKQPIASAAPVEHDGEIFLPNLNGPTPAPIAPLPKEGAKPPQDHRASPPPAPVYVRKNVPPALPKPNPAQPGPQRWRLSEPLALPSHVSAAFGKPKLEQQLEGFMAVATYEHEGIPEDGELSFPKGANITNISFLEDKENWLYGRYGNSTGIFPESYVALQPLEDPNAPLPTPARAPQNKTPTPNVPPRVSTSSQWYQKSRSTIWEIATVEQIAEISQNKEWNSMLEENKEQVDAPRIFNNSAKHPELTLWDVATREQRSKAKYGRERAMWRSVAANVQQVDNAGIVPIVVKSTGDRVNRPVRRARLSSDDRDKDELVPIRSPRTVHAYTQSNSVERAPRAAGGLPPRDYSTDAYNVKPRTRLKALLKKVFN